MSKLPVSVCIIAKNEEKHIENCLKHLVKYGFEIIVADTGSTDNTKQIAQKYADKVVDYEWNNDFSAARNYCASFANNNWILSIDCDEYLCGMDINLFRILLQKHPRSVGTFRLKNLTISSNGKESYVTDDVTRLYNKNFYIYEGKIHEQITPKDMSKRSDSLSCFFIPIEVIHHGYAISKEEMRVKQQRNLYLLYANLQNGQEDPYLYFQIGQSQFILEDYESAIENYEKSLTCEPSIELLYVQVMIMSLAKAYVKANRNEEALFVLKKYETSCKTARYLFTYAGVLFDCKQYMKSLLMYVKTTTAEDLDTLGENELYCYEKIAYLYGMFGNPAMAAVFRDRYEACKRKCERILSS